MQCKGCSECLINGLFGVWEGQVVQETLRLYPTGATLGRKANQDVHMENVFIPKGAFVMVPVYAMHRNPNLFSDPGIDFIHGTTCLQMVWECEWECILYE